MPEIHINSISQINQKENFTKDLKKVSSAIQIIRFFIDNFEFSLDIMDVKEIKEMDTIRNLPNSLPFVKGLLNLRGDIIPILDLKKKLELENLSLEDLIKIADQQNEKRSEVSKDSVSQNINNQINSNNINEFQSNNASIIICKIGSENFGIVVDRIYRVQYLSVDEYEPAPELFESIGKNFIKGFAKIDNKVILILSLSNLFF